MLRYAVLIVAGCNQVYGLDPTRLPDAAPAFPVTGQLMQRWAENDPAGNFRVLEAPLSKTNDIYLAVRVGETEHDLDVDAGGSFTFTRSAEDEPYVLVLTTDGEVSELHHDAPDIRYLLRTAGRFDAARVEESLDISFPATANTVSGVVASTGVFGNVAASPFGGSYSFDWQRAGAGSSRNGLVSSSKGDVLYNFELANRTSPEGLSYQTVVTKGRHTNITMGTMPVTLPAPTPVTPQPCSKLVGPLDREDNRFGPTTKLFIREYNAWAVVAVPSHETAAAGGVAIASGVRFGATAPLAITQNVFNPIDGSSLVATASTSLYRFFRHPDAALALYQKAALSFVVPLDCATAQTTVVPAEQIGIPGNHRLQGVALDTDYVDVPLPDDRNAELELAWDLASPGRVDYYAIALSEVRNAGDVTGFNLVRAFQTPKSRLAISQAGLVRGRYYMFEVTALMGFPGAAGGDLTRLEYPFAAVQSFTAVFRFR